MYTPYLLGIPLTIHIYRTCINQELIDTVYVLGLWPRLRPVSNTIILIIAVFVVNMIVIIIIITINFIKR
jgi:hypothetical protein